jgi:transcription elongation factor SPT6
LELLEENTGASFRNRLTRLRRGRDSASPPAAPSSKPKAIVESSDDDLDEGLPKVQDIQRIWEDAEDDIESFIASDEDFDERGEIGEDERAEKRRQRKKLEKQRREALGDRPGIVGMDAK